jgi:predicted O-methyltransferase YrrM
MWNPSGRPESISLQGEEWSLSSDKYAEYRGGSTEPETVGVLCALVAALKPHALIETGTYEGRTTVKLLDAMSTYSDEHGAMLITVEHDQDRLDQARDFIYNTPRPEGSRAQFTQIQGDALAFLSTQSDESVDFIFLDDDHTSTHVGHEVREALRCLRPGGVLAMHDVVGPFGLAPIVRSHGGICLPLVRLHSAGGLGLIVK